MGAGLRRSLVPMLVGGGIDTKDDPRQVEGGALLELENMYMQRNGELRWRNGYTSLTKSMANGGTITGILSVLQSQNKTLCAIASTASGGPPSIRIFLQYDPVAPTWRFGNDANPLPTITATTAGVSAAQVANGIFTINNGHADPDSAVAGEYLLTCWSLNGGQSFVPADGAFMHYLVSNESTGAVVIGERAVPMGGGTIVGRRARAVAGGSSFLCMVCSGQGSPADVIISSINTATMAVTTTTLVVAGGTGGSPSVRSKPGSNNILIAFSANGGGVTCLEVNPATNAIVTGPVNIASADASQCLSWLEDKVPTGSFLLSTAGATSGVVTRVLTAAFAVSATNVIDAGATANVRTVTGYVRTGVANYDVLWDVSTTLPYNTKIRRGRWTGASTLSDYATSLGIVSSAFKGPDGLYYLLASFASGNGTFAAPTTQPTYMLLNTSVASTDPAPVASHCNLFSQTAGGANRHPNAPTSVSVTSSGKYLVAVIKTLSFTGPSGTPQLQVSVAKFDFNARPLRPRELGNALFVPGGIQTKYDGSSESWSTFPLYPEKPALTQSTGAGNLTLLGTYDYFFVYKRIDSTGRIIRSAPSVATSITLTGTNNTVTFAIPSLRVIPLLNEDLSIEYYRRGPTASGASTINLIDEVRNNPSSDTTAATDVTTDGTAATGELLYTTGGILENFPPPPHSLLEVNAGRVWVVNAEDPTELWPSKEYKSGVGIGFHQLLAFRVTGDGYGAITALAAMDGRLVVFKSGAIYIITGDGPNDAGQGSFNPPQCVSLSIGTVLPGSAVATPDGIMFQSAKGIYLLSRGFALTYIGKQVEKYTLAENVVDASLVDNSTQVRFVQPSGRTLVYDYDLQRWCTFLLPVGASSIVSCANISTGWCYATADGTVRQEVVGQYSDDGVAIQPRIVFPYTDLAGINGFQRLYALQILGEYVGNHTLIADLEYDYSGVSGETHQRAITSGAYQYEIRLERRKCSAMKLTLTCSLASGSGGFRLTGVSAEVGLKSGSNIPYGRRFPG